MTLFHVCVLVWALMMFALLWLFFAGLKSFTREKAKAERWARHIDQYPAIHSRKGQK